MVHLGSFFFGNEFDSSQSCRAEKFERDPVAGDEAGLASLALDLGGLVSLKFLNILVCLCQFVIWKEDYDSLGMFPLTVYICVLCFVLYF